mgnify:CR=1 FL=1
MQYFYIYTYYLYLKSGLSINRITCFANLHLFLTANFRLLPKFNNPFSNIYNFGSLLSIERKI